MNVKLYIFLALTLFIVGCNAEDGNKAYTENTSISDVKGIPNDSLTYYFPSTLLKNSKTVNSNIDTFQLMWYSSALYCANEPILYNFYQNRDIYRFLWLRSCHRPMVFTLIKKHNEVSLNIKELNRNPQFCDETYIRFSEPDHNGNRKADTIFRKANRQSKLTLDRTIKLTIKEWNKLESLIEAATFWELKPQEESSGLDGSRWIIEGHLENQYWFVDRWSPKGEIREAGEYLIHLSKIDKK